MILYLSEFLGLSVFDSSGTKVGRVSELAAQPGTHPPRVSKILLRNGKGTTGRAVSWSEIDSIEPDRIRLRVSQERLGASPSDESFLMLRKDLLDQQIIDINGRKVVRVNDLLLEKRSGAEGLELLLPAVDIGLDFGH